MVANTIEGARLMLTERDTVTLDGRNQPITRAMTMRATNAISIFLIMCASGLRHQTRGAHEGQGAFSRRRRRNPLAVRRSRSARSLAGPSYLSGRAAPR